MYLKQYTAPLIAMCICALGCGQQDMSAMQLPESSVGAKKEPNDLGTPDSPQKTPHRRMMIRNGELRFETNDAKKTWLSIRGSVKGHSGYIADEREHLWNGIQETTVVIRVPSKEFGDLVTEVSESVEAFDTRQIDSTEVTDQFVDLEARLNIRKASRQRLTELIDDAKTVDEILKIEEQITSLQETIESAEGSLRLLQDQVDLSTLTVIFYVEMPDVKPWFVTRLIQRLHMGWVGVKEVVLSFAVLWPLAIVVAAIAPLLWRIRRLGKRVC